MPEWLENITNLDYLPIDKVLQDSVYYPACYDDGSIVKEFNGYAHSFVYVDYEMERANLESRFHTFAGYKVLFKREVTMEELCFRPFNPIFPLPSDGDPSVKKNNAKRLYAVWVILERLPTTDIHHGAEKFSLLYIKGEGCATYQALYYSNQVAPSIVVARGTDLGFGGNWTDFFKKGGFYERTVLSNPYGKPDYLCAGSDVNWNEFNTPLLREWKRRSNTFSLRRSGRQYSGATVLLWERDKLIKGDEKK
jgi:hypothetical protein